MVHETCVVPLPMPDATPFELLDRVELGGPPPSDAPRVRSPPWRQ